MSDTAVAYAQLLGLGLPWVALHCGAMCGPLAAGLTAPLPTRGDRLRAVGAYQVGRAIVYLPLGALAGALGHALLVHPIVSVAASFFASAALLVLAFAPKLGAGSTLLPAAALVRRMEGRGTPAKLVRAARRALARGQVFPVGVAGFVLGALPCMLPAWVLGLAATTGSAVHGAVLMGLLLVASAFPLAAASLLLPRTARGRLASVIPRAALTLSAVWLALGALASMHVVPHGRLVVLGRSLTFW